LGWGLERLSRNPRKELGSGPLERKEGIFPFLPTIFGGKLIFLKPLRKNFPKKGQTRGLREKFGGPTFNHLFPS